MIRIVTDSTSDISAERAKELGVEILPLSVLFGEESFRDGVDISKEEFYARLSQVETLPTTAQVTPDAFIEAFRRLTGNGDQVLGIFLSSDLSGTYQSAMIARDVVDEENIAVVDSRTVTFAEGLLVEAACLLRDQGLSLAELTEKVTELSGRVRLLAVLDTLKYLKMGGRISGATAVVGGLLGICPIISIEGGWVVSVGKGRGRKAPGLQFIEKWIDEKESIDTSLPVCFGHSDNPKAMADCMAFFREKTAGVTCLQSDIAVVGTHAGPGAAGIAFFVAK